jgi:two-component system, chemotaxis family, response regulator PixG
MNAKITSEKLIVREFTAPKQLKLFSSLQESKVSGQLTFTDPIQGSEWYFYLYLGRIVYATGGIHPIRRWQRSLISNLPQIPFQLSSLQDELTEREADLNNNIWEYEQISHWVEKQIITPQQGRNAILFVVSEILFDITQARQIICRLSQNTVLPYKLKPIESEELINQTQQNWENWENAEVADRSPNLAPIILKPQELQEKTSIPAYQSLCKLLNGNRTLRDLAVQLRTSPLQAASSLLPYIQSGIFGLVKVPDLLELLNSSNVNYDDQNRPLIACVDDSLMIAQMMEQIVGVAGYRFIAINDPLQAVSTLIDHEPDLIFLDIVMPKINGYDLCAQLRKYPAFESTPIIFLTSSAGIVDRLRAKMVGSSDFVKKTVDADELLQKIAEHLN